MFYWSRYPCSIIIELSALSRDLCSIVVFCAALVPVIFPPVVHSGHRAVSFLSVGYHRFAVAESGASVCDTRIFHFIFYL